MSDILSIPELAFEKILSYLSYDEIASNRLVSRRFNSVCSGMLTKGFIQLEKKHAHIYKFVKSLLPKRPSERRSNVLVSRYCEILQGMETRIRMLNVTYMRYIDQQLICFVPGKVLDEINRLLRLIEMRFDPPTNNNLLLEELRDLSSMAMEHFDEHILPHLEKREEALQYENNLPSTSKPSEEERMHKELRKLYKRNRVFKSQLGYIISKTRQLCDKWNRQNMRVKKQSSIIKEQNAKLLVQATRIENHEMTISEMKKKIEELQSSFVEVKSKWEFESTQNVSSNARIFYKNTVPENVSSSISKNLSKLVQFENRCQKPNILKKIGNRSVLDNRSVFIKPRTQKLKADELKRRKYKSMVDVDIWRRCCPTSRLSYSMWYRNYMKNKSTKLETLKKDPNLEEPSCSQSKPEEVKSPKKAPGFVYKSIIKQRCSKVFPLTCLNLERKRKSYVCPDVPSKISKIESNNNFKALDLINKYLPTMESNSSPMIRKKSCSTTNNPSSFTTEPILSYKRKRENDGET
ncbi:hypothetical protein WA026_016453 [Henosepilachna vigintioctopunctata]|uniref:F-box domain-containing protein n=1 Tax=Henosepilachna vigintioctopunctata TaxID=420089 RepID=A0AAW1UQ24_9CUCU